MINYTNNIVYSTLNVKCCVIGPVLFEICSGNKSVRQKVVGHNSEPKVGQSSYTPKGTTRPPRGVVCKICRRSDKYFQRYAPETKCSRTAQRRNIIISPL